MSDWITVAGLTWRALRPFGVELDHDLSAPLSRDLCRPFVDLLGRKSLIRARRQHLSMARQEELCALAGPILHRQGESGYLSTDSTTEATLSELWWHADAAYTTTPLEVISLHAIDVIDAASSTRFVNAQDALESLAPELRRKMGGRKVEMISSRFDVLALRTCDRRDPVGERRGIRPAIYRNPHNDRDAIWMSEMQTTRIMGLEWEESRDLPHAIFDDLYQPAHVLEHRWRNGDFIVWDNIALQHMRGALKSCGKRVLQRVIMATAGAAPHVRLAS